MRELKFRAWSKKHKKYLKITGIQFDGDKVAGVFVVFGTIAGIPNIIFLESEDIILEQYTGLKDKNGKEIYEGDIVKARWYRAKNARLDTRGEVKFNDGWFYIHDDPDGQDRLGVPIHNCYDMEVIGNIHEDPELLEDEKCGN